MKRQEFLGELPTNDIRRDLTLLTFVDSLTEFKDISDVLLICSVADMIIAHKIQKELRHLNLSLLFIPDGLRGNLSYWCVCSLQKGQAIFDGIE